MKNHDIIDLGKNYIMETYNRFPVVIERGKGCCVWDVEGNKYLDFVSGVAVNTLGYKNKTLLKNLKKQLKNLSHCSNLYFNIPQLELACILVKNSCFDKAFFCNSGTEAIETAIKLVRKYTKQSENNEKFEIISMKKSFHGRSTGSVALTGQEKYQKDFLPLMAGIRHAEFNNIESVKSLINDKTCAIFIEPVQGEGGVYPADKGFLEELRNICTQKDILLVFDEAQCGVGRTGKLFAYQHYNIEPDIICLAKGLGAGIPIGAVMAVKHVAKVFEPGDHGATFGGNPLACTAGLTVLQKLVREGVLENSKNSGNYLKLKLVELKQKYPFIKEVRGMGLMQGIELDFEVVQIIKKAINQGLLLAGAGKNTIRLIPPLIITKNEIDKAVEILSGILGEVK